MNILIIYDSQYGNTEKIAQAMAGALAPDAAVTLRRFSQVTADDWAGVDLLFIGSPTQGFSPTRAMQQWLPAQTAHLRGVACAVFDTRMVMNKTTIKSGFFRWFVDAMGYAAPKLSKRLQRLGVKQAALPEGFFVLGSEGPLQEGELERAAAWARQAAAPK